MMNKFILLHVLVMILSSWLWVIVQRNILVGLLVFVLSIVLFIYFRQSRPKKIRLLLLILNIVLIIIVFKQAFDQIQLSIFRNIIEGTSFMPMASVKYTLTDSP